MIVLFLWAVPSLGRLQNDAAGACDLSGVVGLMIEMQLLPLDLVLQTPAQLGLQLKVAWEG